MANPFAFTFTHPVLDEDDDEGPVSTNPEARSSAAETPSVTAEPSERPAQAPTSPWLDGSANPLLDDDDDDEEAGELAPYSPKRAASLPASVAPASSPASVSVPPASWSAAVSITPVTEGTVEDTVASGTGRKKVYNRKLLNKHDDLLLTFLAVVKVANTRILSRAMGSTERQVQQRLKGLQELGLTDNRLMVGTQAIWVVTPKGVRVCHKRGQLTDRPYVIGTRLSEVKNSSIGHKLAEATVAAHFVAGRYHDLVGRVTAANITHENEIVAGYQKARTHLEYRSDVPPTGVRDGVLKVASGREWPGHDAARLYLARRAGFDRPDITKVPDLVVTGDLTVAVEVELYPKAYESYLEILKTYRQDDATYDRLLYVTPKYGTAALLKKAADEVELRDKFLLAPLYDAKGQRFTADPWQL